MKEVWLRSNRRALGVVNVGLVLLALFAAATTIAVVVSGESGLLQVVCLIATGVLFFALGGGIWLMWRPLLAYQSGEMLVNVARTPIRVPIEIVEGFLLGKQELEPRKGKQLEVAALAIRLAEKATDFAKIEMSEMYGRWCGGYINIVGLHTEPLTLDLVNRLNARLAEVQRERSNEASSSQRGPG